MASYMPERNSGGGTRCNLMFMVRTSAPSRKRAWALTEAPSRTHVLNRHLVQRLDRNAWIFFAKFYEDNTAVRLQRVLNVPHHGNRFCKFVIHVHQQYEIERF